jgi:membrane protein involved in colicin uptake
MLKMNLQHFAEEEKPTVEKLELTQEELDAKLQAEADRRVTKALETAKQKWEEEATERIKKAKTEAEELAKLSEKERAEKERQKELAEFEKERKQFYREKLELEATKILSEKKLPTDFAHLVLADDNQQTLDNINKLEENWNKAIEEAVSERLKGKTPKSGGGSKGGVTKEEFNRMGYTRRLELKKTNPELYNELIGG